MKIKITRTGHGINGEVFGTIPENFFIDFCIPVRGVLHMTYYANHNGRQWGYNCVEFSTLNADEYIALKLKNAITEMRNMIKAANSEPDFTPVIFEEEL